MPIRCHTHEGTVSRAVFSACGAYRYSLQRVWDPAAPLLGFVMLNPSTADEMRNDPTVGRCEHRARALGMGGMCVVNLFAWRATVPTALRTAADPVGPDNDAAILDAARRAANVIAAWGVHGALFGRGVQVAAMLRNGRTPLLHLGLTKAGHPRHPLYLPHARQPEPWTQAAVYGR